MMVDAVKNDKNLVRKNSVLNYKKEGSKEIKKVKKSVIGNSKNSKDKQCAGIQKSFWKRNYI